MAVLSEINTRLVQRVKGQRLGERSSSDRSTLSSTLQCLIQTHMSTFHCFSHLLCCAVKFRRSANAHLSQLFHLLLSFALPIGQLVS